MTIAGDVNNKNINVNRIKIWSSRYIIYLVLRKLNKNTTVHTCKYQMAALSNYLHL